MNIGEFQTQYPQEEKILIVDSISNGNCLIRKMNREDTPMLRLRIVQLVEIAREIVTMGLAQEGKVEPVKTMPVDCFVAIVESLLNEEIGEGTITFVSSESMCTNTARDVLLQMNQLRMGKRISAESEDSKIKELNSLIEKYEEKLKEECLYDDCRLLLDARAVMESNSISYKPAAVYGVLDTCRFTYVEQQLIGLITNEYKKITTQAKNTKKVEKHFYRAYGVANEIGYIIKYVQDNNIPYGNVNVLYSSPNYVNYLLAMFGEKEIPYALLGSHSALKYDSVNLLLEILNWAKQDYSYETLMQVMNNPVMRLEDAETRKENKTNGSNPMNSYLSGIRANIGWSLERYKTYIDEVNQEVEAELEALEKSDDSVKKNQKCFEEEKQGETEEEIEGETEEEIKQGEEQAQGTEQAQKRARILRKQSFAKCLDRLTQLFTEIPDKENVNAVDLFETLVKFARDYWTNKNQEWKYISQPFENVKNKLRYKKADKLDVVISQIQDELKNITVQDEVNPGKVSLIALNRQHILEREYNFVIGLSAPAFLTGRMESAVLSDKELQQLLDCKAGYVQIAEQADHEKRETYEKTLATLAKGHIFYGYSYYDILGKKESSPSSYYLDMVAQYSTYSDVGEIEKAKLDNSFIGKDYVISMNERDVVRRLKAMTREIPEIQFSPTALRIFLNCPLAYKYQYIDRIPIMDFLKREPGKWLPPTERGILIHGVLEDYCKKVFLEKDAKNNTWVAVKKPPKTLKTDILDEIFQNRIEESKKKIPLDSEGSYKLEEESYRKALTKYIKDLHAEMSDPNRTKKWMIKECEKEFENVKVCYTETQNDYSIVFKGRIDRIDSYVDAKKVEHLRIIDYKTGKAKNVKSELDKVSEQHRIYALAAKELYPNAEVDEVVFECLMDEEKPRVIFPDDMCRSRNEDKKKEEILEKRKDMSKLPNHVVQEVGKLLSGELDYSKCLAMECKYCDYIKICPQRDELGGTI